MFKCEAPSPPNKKTIQWKSFVSQGVVTNTATLLRCESQTERRRL
jgi:hypothetical protein